MMFVPDACREESSCLDSLGLPPPLMKIPHLTPQTCPLGGIPSTSPVPKPNLKSYGYTSVPAEGTRAPNPVSSPVLSRPGEYSKNIEPSRDNDKSNLSAGGKAKTRRFSLRRESLCARNPVNFRSWLDNLDKFLVEAAAGGYVKTTTTRRPSSSTPATPSPVNQTLLGTVVNPVASGTVLAPAPNLSLAGGTITLLPHPTQISSSSPSTRSVKSGSTPVTVPCLTGVIDLTEEEDKKPGQKTAVTSMPSVAAALCSPPAAGALAQTTGGALLVQQPGGAPLLLQPMAGMTSTAGPLLYTSHPTSFMVQTPATTTSSVLRNPLPISTTLQQQYVVAGSAMTKPPTAAAITTPSTQGQLNQPKPRPAATNQRSIVASAPRIVPKQICQPKPINKPSSQHPAPLPDMPTNATNAAWKKDPPKPGLKISRVKQGIVLSWNMALTDENAAVVNYQLFAYQETAAPPASNLWKKVGNVKALPLPMACTLTQFQEGNKYHFSVRAIDAHGRMGPFSEPGSIHLKGAVS